MAVLRLVVDRRAPLHHLLQLRGVEGLARARSTPDLLGERERRAAVAVRHAHQRGARIFVERQRLPLDRLRPLEQLLDRRRIERLEHQHAGARQERRVELEGRVLGGGANQHDGAVLHHRQEGVLLRPVEAVDLVDEKQRAGAGLAPGAGRVEHLLQVGDAGEDRRDLLEMQLGRFRQQPRHGGLAGAGRSPEHQRAERAGLQHARERAVGPEQMVLAHDVGELGGPQLVGERTRRVAIEAGSREQLGPAPRVARGLIRSRRPTSAVRRA